MDRRNLPAHVAENDLGAAIVARLHLWDDDLDTIDNAIPLCFEYHAEVHVYDHMEPRHDAWAAALETYRHFPRAKDMGLAVFMNGRRGRLRDSLRDSPDGQRDRR